MINLDDQTSKLGQTTFYSELNLSIENKLHLKLPLETLSCEEEYSKFKMISNFLQEQQRKEANSLHSLDSSSRENNTDQDLSSPNLKKNSQNSNMSHFSNQKQNNNSPTKSIAPSNFDDSSEIINSSVFQDFQLQNFIRKRNSEILKNLSRGSLCASDSTQKENNSEDNSEKPSNLLKVLNFDDQYALKRVSLNLGACNKHITPLILLHKRNLMKKVMDNPTKYIASSDSENNITDDEHSFLKEDEEKIAADDRKERNFFLKISVLQTEKHNFIEIVRDNLKKYARNMQEAIHNANIGDIADELDVNEMIKKRMLSRNIEVLDKNERIYRKGTFKQIKMIPFYLFDFENSQMINAKLSKEKYIITKGEDKTGRNQHEIPEFSGFLEAFPEETKDKTNLLQLCLGNIEHNEPKKERSHNIFIKTKTSPSNNNNILFQFLSFQGKFLHSHRLEKNCFKNFETGFLFKENLSVQMKQCSKEFLENLSKNFEKNEVYGQNVKENLIKMLSTPKIFVKDIGSKTGTFVKLKTNNPLMLCEGNLIMITGHLGFFVEEFQTQEIFIEDRGYSNIFVNTVNENNNENLSKKVFFCLKLVFVKKNADIEVYEEYQKIMLIYQKNEDFLKDPCKNFVKFGEKKEIFQNKNPETKKNLIEKIQLKYDFIVGFDAKNEIWFATVADNDKVTTSLSSLPSSTDHMFLTYQAYNKLEDQYSFDTNEDFYEYHKNQGKIVPGINTLDLRMKNTIDELNLPEKFEEDREYINLLSCWVCLSKFSLLKNNFAGNNIEVGDGSIVKFGMSVISLKILPKITLA